MFKPDGLSYYVDTRHDITPPGSFRGRGYWVDKEWKRLLLERPDIAVLQGYGNNKRLSLFVGRIKATSHNQKMGLANVDAIRT